MFHILKTQKESISHLRLKYLKSLPEFQDIMLEFLVVDAAYYSLKFSNELVGYTIVMNGNVMIEFYLVKEFTENRTLFFQQIIDDLAISSVYCKSFDYPLMKCCLQQNLKYKLRGHLYRNLYPGVEQLNSEIIARYADDSDVQFLEGQEDEVFEPKNRLLEFIESKGILIYSKGDTIVGCGFLTQIHPEFDYFDIGVWTNPDYRKQGIATQIILHLKDTCLDKGNIPICGCASGNVASQRTLEKCGFSSKHKLIEFVRT